MTTTNAMSPANRDFWARFLAETDDPKDAKSRFFEAFKIGTAENEADEGARLILSGVKTATSSLLCSYESADKRPPIAGDLSIVMNGRNEPVCVIETTWSVIQPFALVDERFARDYGEWDRTLPTWREKCWAHYSDQCQALRRSPNQEVPLVCERFRVIFPRRAKSEPDVCADPRSG